MKRLIVPIIILMTLSACSQLGLSSAEPAEPVDLSNIESRLEAIEDKLNENTETLKEVGKELKDFNKKPILNKQPAKQPNTKEDASNKPAGIVLQDSEGNVRVQIEDNKGIKPKVLYDVLYGRTVDNPVIDGKPLVISLTDMKTDFQTYANCGSNNPECYISLYVKEKARITWDYPANGAIHGSIVAEDQYVRFLDHKGLVPHHAELPARMDINGDNIVNGCNEWNVSIIATEGYPVPNQLFSSYHILCIAN